MHLRQIDIVKSPDFQNRIRLIGEITYDDKSIKPELYWFEISEKYGEFISSSGNPWLVCLIPLAVTRGEPLKICNPVDKVLFDNIQRLMKIWKCWDPNLHIVPIEAELIDGQENNKILKTAAFFSAGIDSFFTVLRHSNNSLIESDIKIDDLITVWGFDIPISNPEAFYRKRDTLKRTAFELDKNLIDISTNLRMTLWKQIDWGKLSHGCALASTALVLEKRYAQVLIASTGGYADLHPWGSHVLTDPLLSTSKTSIVHDGSEFTRIEKTAFVSKSKIAMQSLHVCWILRSDKNCGNCSKCYRTMIMLDLYNSLSQFATFDFNKYKVSKIKKIFLEYSYHYLYMEQCRKLAYENGKRDIVKAINCSIRRSKKISKYLPIAKKIKYWLKRKRFFWRWADLLERCLLSDSII